MRSPGRSGVLLLVLVSALGVVAGAAPTSAAPRPAADPQIAVYRPDGWVRYYRYHSTFGNYVDPKPWVGDNIYNSTGTNQTAKEATYGTYEPSDFFEFQVLIQNDGSSDRFKVHATGQGSTFKYFHGSTNITAAVVAGTFRTPSIGPGATFTIKVRVSIVTGARLIRLTSVADPTKSDTVKVSVKYGGCGC